MKFVADYYRLLLRLETSYILLHHYERSNPAFELMA